MEEKTITAISTPLGSGGISIIRLSGPQSLQMARKVFFSSNKNAFKPNVLALGIFKTNTFNEKCMCVYFKAPNSYTGEDVVEFQCHGGQKICDEILKTLVDGGASLAEPGEFTKRAFMNGKVSLEQAEGVMDIINAESESEIKAGYSLIDGGLKKVVRDMQDKLSDLIAKIEVSLDYPEYEYEQQLKAEILDTVNNLEADINNILQTSVNGLKIKSGINVLILGKPNVGKSSLMNAMLGYDRAIVTDIKGTTRDILQETYIYNGVKFNIIDTAGIRETSGVEKIGVDLAKKAINNADVVLFIVDLTQPLDTEDLEVFKSLKNKIHLIIANKTDIFNNDKIDKNINIIVKKLQYVDKNVTHNDIMLISAINKKGINNIKDKVYNLVFANKLDAKFTLTNTRHYEAFTKAKQACQTVKQNITFASMDLVSVDIKNIWLALGEITGETNNEDIINKIFSNFCVGK